MKRIALLLFTLFAVLMAPMTARAQPKKPNIVVIMADDVGIWTSVPAIKE